MQEATKVAPVHNDMTNKKLNQQIIYDGCLAMSTLQHN